MGLYNIVVEFRQANLDTIATDDYGNFLSTEEVRGLRIHLVKWVRAVNNTGLKEAVATIRNSPKFNDAEGYIRFNHIVDDAGLGRAMFHVWDHEHVSEEEELKWAVWHQGTEPREDRIVYSIYHIEPLGDNATYGRTFLQPQLDDSF